MARDAFRIEVQNYGMACQPSQSRQPPCIVSRKLSKAVLLYFDLFRFAFYLFYLGSHFNIIVNRF